MTTEETAKIARQIEELNDLSVDQLRQKWEDVWGEPCRTRNKDNLKKRIAWRIQSLAFGGLSQRALDRAAELVDETLLRILPPRKAPVICNANQITHGFNPSDTGQPMPGAIITRMYKGRKLIVTVCESGYEHDGVHYKSLSAVAQAITGAHWNGRAFFGLPKPKEVA